MSNENEQIAKRIANNLATCFPKATTQQILDALDLKDQQSTILKLENESLRKFASYVLQSYCWDNCAEPDGGEIQDKAESLGLIELRPISPEDSIDGETEHYFTKWTPK